ncbi:MAG: enolase C-terminal domain-like protein [Planctomycetaceae bacterium]
MSSRIVSVETFPVSYPVTGRFRFFAGKGTPRRETIVVKIADDAGHVGWGQSVPSPTWSYETIDTVRTTIDRHLGPALVGIDPFDEPAIRRVLDRTIAPSFSTGQPICKAGIDLALYDLAGRARNSTANDRWNRAGNSHVTLSWTLDPGSLDDIPELIAEAHARGFRHFNAKVGPDPEFDVAMCREVRRIAPEAFLWVDANGGYEVEQALALAPRLADLGVAAFEQPLRPNRLSGFKRLMEQGALPILMDEPIITRTDLEEFHRLGLLDGVAMKVSRCGGLSEAVRIMEYVEAEGLLFFASGLTDPDLSFAASLLLFGAYRLERPAALNGPQFLSGSILSRPIEVTGDQARVPTGMGLGVVVDENKLTSME